MYGMHVDIRRANGLQGLDLEILWVPTDNHFHAWLRFRNMSLYVLSSYQKHFLQEIMLHVLDVRDALDTDRFLHVHFDPVFDAQSSKSSNDGGAGAGAKSGSQVAEEQGIWNPYHS